MEPRDRVMRGLLVGSATTRRRTMTARALVFTQVWADVGGMRDG